MSNVLLLAQNCSSCDLDVAPVHIVILKIFLILNPLKLEQFLIQYFF